MAFADTLVDMIQMHTDDSRVGIVSYDDEATAITDGYLQDPAAVKAALASYEYLPGAPDGETRWVCAIDRNGGSDTAAIAKHFIDPPGPPPPFLLLFPSPFLLLPSFLL